MSRKDHWILLENDPATQEFKRRERKVVNKIQDLFGFKLDGDVVEINSQSYGVGFDIRVRQDSQNSQSKFSQKTKIFPDYENRSKLSYWCSATRIKNTGNGLDFETFANDFSFEHNFRISEFVTPILLDEMRQSGIYVDTVKDSQPPTMKRITTSDNYVDNISDGMDVVEDLVEIDE